MSEDEIAKAMVDLIAAGLMEAHEGGDFSLTPAGKDYVEQVMMPRVTNREMVYALGVLYGRREAERRSK